MQWHASAGICGVCGWIPVILVYCITLALIMAFAGGWSEYRRRLQPSDGAWGWRFLSFAPTALFIPLFLLNFRSLNQPWVISSWLAVAIVDPWLEEGYWRGLLTASGVFRFEARPRSLCRRALPPSFRSRFSNVRTPRTL